VLRQALQAGVRLAWISNFTTERQIWKLRLLGLDDVRAVLVTSEEAGADKPDPAMVDLALQRLGIDVTEPSAWIIGDEPADVEAAQARGLPALVLRREGGNETDRAHAVRNWNEIGELLLHARN
jgi:putative hydrolase of the HAD superfamily